MKITYYAAISEDGFIARLDGDVSWLESVDTTGTETEMETFFSAIDGLAMGRKTYDFVFDYGSWPYGDKPSWICTSRELECLSGANLHVVSSVEQIVNEVNRLGLKHLWLVGGGKLASGFLSNHLITQIKVTVLPVKLETGIPLFSDHELDEISCSRREEKDFGNYRQIEITC